MCRDRRISLTRPVRPFAPVRRAALRRQDGSALLGWRREHAFSLCYNSAWCWHVLWLCWQHPLLRCRHSPSLPGASLLLGTLDRILLLLLFKKLYLYMRSKLLSLARGVASSLLGDKDHAGRSIALSPRCMRSTGDVPISEEAAQRCVTRDGPVPLCCTGSYQAIQTLAIGQR